jgi:hypothetical protein
MQKSQKLFSPALAKMHFVILLAKTLLRALSHE